MVSLEKLKRENQRLKAESKRKLERLNNVNKAQKEIISIGKQREKLIRENKALKFAKKHPRALRAGKAFIRGSDKFAVEGTKVAKKFGRGLVILSKRIEEANRREKAALKKLEKARTKKKVKRKIKRKR